MDWFKWTQSIPLFPVDIPWNQSIDSRVNCVNCLSMPMGPASVYFHRAIVWLQPLTSLTESLTIAQSPNPNTVFWPWHMDKGQVKSKAFLNQPIFKVQLWPYAVLPAVSKTSWQRWWHILGHICDMCFWQLFWHSFRQYLIYTYIYIIHNIVHIYVYIYVIYIIYIIHIIIYIYVELCISNFVDTIIHNILTQILWQLLWHTIHTFRQLSWHRSEQYHFVWSCYNPLPPGILTKSYQRDNLLRFKDFYMNLIWFMVEPYIIQHLCWWDHHCFAHFFIGKYPVSTIQPIYVYIVSVH